MGEFTVCIPGHSHHYRCFEELAESVAWSLQQLGHVAHRDAAPRAGTRVIYLGAPLGTPAPDAIFFNTEQVSKDSYWHHNSLGAYYKGRAVWDYSAANAERYEGQGLPNPPVVRPGYCPWFEGRLTSDEKNYDVAFFGSINDRRESMLREIEALGLHLLRVPFGLYGAERDKLLAQARLALNIHFYESAIFESVRCSYLAQGGLPVLSETSHRDEGEAYGMLGVPYGQLVARAVVLVRGVVGGAPILEGLAATQRKAVERISMVDDIGAALEHTGSTDVARVSVLASDKPRPTKHEITLCMIVKDEADVIERCLASVKPLLSHWCIVDTGSTDGTQEIIRKFMADLPGQLHECSWKEFDGSRSEAVDLARVECKNEGWLLTLDADEQLRLTGELELPDGYDCYNAWFTRCEGCTQWARPMFMRADKPWFYEMPRHEGLYCRTHAPSAPMPVPNISVLSTMGGARAKESERDRYLRDAHVLEAWLPQHPGHSRAQFYLAQSYHCAAAATSPPDRALMQKAIAHFLKRAEMDGFAEESFAARYQAGQCMVNLGYPWERIQHTFLQAYSMRTSRAEPLYNIARYYREQGDAERSAGRPSAGRYALAELFARKAAYIGPTEDSFADVDHTVNDWRAKDELATALTYLGGHAEARELLRHVLRSPSIAPHDRARIEANLEMCKRMAPDPA